MRDHRPAHQVDAADVDLHHPIEELGLCLEHVPHACDARVVEQHVDAAPAVDHPRGKVHGLRLVSDVDLLGDRLAARLHDLVGGGARGSRVQVGDDHAPALGGEEPGARLADA